MAPLPHSSDVRCLAVVNTANGGETRAAGLFAILALGTSPSFEDVGAGLGSLKATGRRDSGGGSQNGHDEGGELHVDGLVAVEQTAGQPVDRDQRIWEALSCLMVR